MNSKCRICGTPFDDLGLCDPYCPVVIAEDDQARAEAHAAMRLPDDENARYQAVAMDALALARFQRMCRSHGG
jgi:hypothetical protein